MIMRPVTLWAIAVASLATVACSKPQQETQAPPPAPPEQATAAPHSGGGDSAAIDAAIASTERPDGDRNQDSWRKPADVLAFMELRPGMRVLDYLAAGGYYTELISRAVGPDGQVIAYNNEPYAKYAGKEPAARYGDNRLANVKQVTTTPEAMPLEPESIDAVLFMQTYHDLYWRNKDWPTTDPAKSLAHLAPALKPGAVVVVVDHVAAQGSDPTQTVDKLHRIDPQIIKRDFAAAGLKFEAESEVFRAPADDHTKEVFDDAIRHKTDQVMYKFRKG
jgi:predicted methyltransferase